MIVEARIDKFNTWNFTLKQVRLAHLHRSQDVKTTALAKQRLLQR